MAYRMQTRTGMKQSFQVRVVTDILSMSALELDQHLAETARENPLIVVRPRHGHHPGAGGTTDILEAVVVEDHCGLYDHVSRELRDLLAMGGLLERVVLRFMEALEPSGWLGCTTAEIARDLELSLPTVETALETIQRRVEPAGLFARDLRECLTLQLRDRDQYSDQMAGVLENLDLLQTGGLEDLAKRAGLTTDQTAQCVSVIRRLDPKPGARFEHDPTLMREPDVRLTEGPDGWVVDWNDQRKAEVSVAEVPKGGANSKLKDAALQARSLQQALHLRQSAADRIVRAVVARQQDFFRAGAVALTPMTMAEIAEETGFHTSTVSRVLNGLLIEGPNGVSSAKALFASASSVQGGTAKPKVLCRIRSLLKAEDPHAPLSDRRLADMLCAEGLDVSRRVIAKYRNDLGMPAASQRRHRANHAV